MKFRIHYIVNRIPEHVDLEGETIEDIQNKWAKFSKGKPYEEPWSEQIAGD
jgi:hypothetical protein